MSATPSKEDQALLDALQSLLLPLGRLLVERGVHYGDVDERLKLAMIQAARQAALQATPQALPHRLVSRIATSTGINRREVTRLVNTELSEQPQRQSLPLRLFARWNSDPAWQDDAGVPRTLPRQGQGLSFETLSALVSRDVHPRSVLDDLIRLKLVTWDAAADTVALARDRFVPDDDQVRALGYLGANVGDHLSAAIENVSGREPRHLEQSIHATGLAASSVEAMRSLVASQWKQLVGTFVPALQGRIDADSNAGEGNDQRLRIGFYVYSTTGAAPAEPAQESEDE